MNHTPFDRDDLSRESERTWDRRDARERAIRFGDDAVSRAQADLEALRKAKAEAEARRHKEWGNQP